MTARPPHPDEVRARVEQMRRRYTVHVHHDLRRGRWRSWSATITHGVFHVGYPTCVWSARTRERLIAKCERWIARDMLRNGLEGRAEIRISE